MRALSCLLFLLTLPLFSQAKSFKVPGPYFCKMFAGESISFEFLKSENRQRGAVLLKVTHRDRDGEMTSKTLNGYLEKKNYAKYIFTQGELKTFFEYTGIPVATIKYNAVDSDEVPFSKIYRRCTDESLTINTGTSGGFTISN